MKKTLLICQSIHHGNTWKVAEVLATSLQAEIKKATDIDPSEIVNYQLIGFGSGIYDQQHHPSLFRLIEKIPEMDKQKAFIYSTFTIFMDRMHQKLRDKLKQKGFEIVGEFNCKGLMTHSFTKFFLGGLNKGRPNEKDLERARIFAEKLSEKIGSDE